LNSLTPIVETIHDGHDALHHRLPATAVASVHMTCGYQKQI